MVVDTLLLNIIYIYMKEDHRSYKGNFCSCQKKVWKIQACNGLTSKPECFPAFFSQLQKLPLITSMIFFHIILHVMIFIYS